MTDQTRISLRHAAFDLQLAPAVGGAIARFDHLGTDGTRTPILRGADSANAVILDMGCFPLVPFCNRIRGGSFMFRGRTVTLAPNLPGDPNPLHGQGWQERWEVAHFAESEAMLTFRHQAGEWPWAYEARQHFRLDEAGLRVILSCRNLSQEPMPCGLGQHPYFACTEQTELDTQVEDVWTVDADVLPVERLRAAGRYDLHRRTICGQQLDNGFSDWSGEAWIRSPGAPFAIRLSSPNAAFFQVYSPADGGLFVAEPVTHANCALNAPEIDWPALGLRVLAYGEEMALEARIDVASLTTR